MLSCHLFLILMKKRRLPCPYLVEKRKFCQNYTILWDKNVNKMHFFPIYHEKISAPMPIFCQKKTSILYKHNAFMPIFCQQNVHSFKNTLLSCHIFQIFHLTPPHVILIFGQKNVNSVKTTLYYGPKKSIRCPFFPIFHEQITALMPLFCYQNVHFLKTLCFHANILSKNVNPLKNTMLSCHFFQIVNEKTPAVMPIYG